LGEGDFSVNQRRAPLFEALKHHVIQNYAGFHFPGHSGGAGLLRAFPDGREFLRFDLTELPGLDDLHAPAGPIARAQELAAALYGADRTFFLVNGSTAGVQALLLAATAPGEKVLVPRNAHRAVIGGLVLSGADPVYVTPPYDSDWGFCRPSRPADLRAALRAHPGVRAVLLTHPDYYGQAAVDAETAAVLKESGALFLADEAHGAHLPFHAAMPAPALGLGAASAAQSLHKLGGALTQASLLHLKGTGLSPARVGRALALLQTSSPSYLLMASLDLARRQLAVSGERLLGRAVELAGRLRRGLAALGGVEVFDAGPGRADPTKVPVSTRGLGLSGYQAAAWLRERHAVQVEAAGRDHLLFVVGLGTRAPDVARALSAFRALVREHLSSGLRPPVSGFRPLTSGLRPPFWPVPPAQKVLTPRESWFLPARAVPLREASGLVAAETVSLCPPGIPIVFPGEKLTPEVLEYILEIRAGGVAFQAAEPGLETILVHDGY
jgi:arginine/lysine/ornithine decarboxylase